MRVHPLKRKGEAFSANDREGPWRTPSRGFAFLIKKQSQRAKCPHQRGKCPGQRGSNEDKEIL